MVTVTPKEIGEKLEVLFWQEASCYRTDDYIEMMKLNPCLHVVDDTSEQGQPPDPEDANEEQEGFSIRDPATDAPAPGEARTTGGVEQEHPPAEEAPTPQPLIREQWREVMCEWCYNLVDHFDLPRERVAVCMNLTDRYLFKYLVLSEEPPTMDKKHFQLLSLTCMYLAIKLDGQTYLSIDSMMRLGRGIQRHEIIQMEQDILFLLDWHVHPPTPYIFLRYYLLLLNPEALQLEILDLAKFYLELSVLDYQFVRHRPSRIAMASLLNAIQDKLPTRFSKYYEMMSLLITPSNDMKTVQKCRKRLYYLFCAGRGWDDSSSSETSNTTSGSSTNNNNNANANVAPANDVNNHDDFDTPPRNGTSSSRLRCVT